ncbi:MAG: hypothetical protein HYX57_04995 [Chloroflexi bacterium]|nr:hypothetical protein [Chloroflexota bacterium]
MNMEANDSPGRSDDWVSELGAAHCQDSAIFTPTGPESVAAYCIDFDAIGPRRAAKERRDSWRDDYGKVLIRGIRDEGRSVPEIEVVKAFHRAGWHARWQDSFGGAPSWMRPWTQSDPPPPRAVLSTLRAIRESEASARPWDILAWRGDGLMFVECKAPGEPFTRGEQAFYSSARRAGIAVRQFAVVRGSVSYPLSELGP